MLTNYVIPGISWSDLILLAQKSALITISPPSASGYLLTSSLTDESTVWLRATEDQGNSWLFSHVDATAILQQLCALGSYQFYSQHDPKFIELAGPETTPEALAKLEREFQWTRKGIIAN